MTTHGGRAEGTPCSIDHVAAFRDAMAEAGVACGDEIAADGKLHRFMVGADKKGGKKSGWYVLHLDERPAGGFGSWRGESHTWSAKGLRSMTPADRDEMARKVAEKRSLTAAADAAREAKSAAAAQAMWDNATDATDDHPYLKRKGVQPYGLRIGDWVKERLDGSTYVAAKGALLIPIRDECRNITSLQAIFASPIKMGDELRDKDFVYGGRKRGCWFTIGKPTDVDGKITVAMCEGYATGADIHRWTGLAVVVAFDARNLVVVAETARRLMPDARIVTVGDNDLWTKKPDGTPWNPGVEAAEKAAAIAGGPMVVPRFVDLSSSPTDFNDLRAAEGGGAVKRQILAAISPALAGPAPAPPAADDDAPFDPRGFGVIDPDDSGMAPPGQDDDDEDEKTDGHFRVLGHDRTHIYVYQHRMKLILSRGHADWGESALLTLAPLVWWEREFGCKLGINKKMALNWLLRQAERKGFFDPNCRRGRGAWRDDGRLVYHFGDRLMVDGELRPNLKINSAYVYEQARRLATDAERLKELQ